MNDFIAAHCSLFISDLITWLVDHGSFDALTSPGLKYGGGPRRRALLRRGAQGLGSTVSLSCRCGLTPC